MINFMLPTQIGAMTLDGTWLIAIGIIAVAGIIYKNRNNISLTGTETNINKDSNTNKTIEVNETDIQTNKREENNIEDLDEEEITMEKETILN